MSEIIGLRFDFADAVATQKELEKIDDAFRERVKWAQNALIPRFQELKKLFSDKEELAKKLHNEAARKLAILNKTLAQVKKKSKKVPSLDKVNGIRIEYNEAEDAFNKAKDDHQNDSSYKKARNLRKKSRRDSK